SPSAWLRTRALTWSAVATAWPPALERPVGGAAGRPQRALSGLSQAFGWALSARHSSRDHRTPNAIGRALLATRRASRRSRPTERARRPDPRCDESGPSN